MTTQNQLVQLAEKHQNNPAISALLLSLQEARMTVLPTIQAVRAAANAVDYALKDEPGFSIPLDNTHHVMNAAKLAAALTRMSADYYTLATVLQALGEPIEF